MRLALVLLLLLPAPALADDAATLRACLEGAADHGELPQSCKGTLSDPCIEALALPDYAPTAECVAGEAAAWDALLNEEWKALMGILSDEEKEMMRTAQRAWIAYRDADCDAALRMAHPARGGLWYSDCLLSRTADRVIALREVVADRGN